MVSWDRSLLALLKTTMGLEDLHDFLEVITVDNHNQRLMDDWRRRNEGR